MKLGDLHENEDNPRKVTDDDIDALAKKLERNEGGLKAMRIAYVKKGEKNIVISGNTRLKALLKIHGADWEIPDEYVADLTSLSEAERHEFIVNANKNDGDWDLDKLLQQYSTDELKEYGVDEALKHCPLTDFDDVPDSTFDRKLEMLDEKEKEDDSKEKNEQYVVCPYCGKETSIRGKRK